MSDCPVRILVLPRHLSAHDHAAMAVCELDRHDTPDEHTGRLLEVDGPHVVETFDTLVTWQAGDRRSFRRASHGRAVLEPDTCRGEPSWVPGARCCLPSGHPGECAP